MKTIHTETSALAVWSCDRGTKKDGKVVPAIVIGIPYTAPTEEMGVAKVFLTIEQAEGLARELGFLIGKAEAK